MLRTHLLTHHKMDLELYTSACARIHKQNVVTDWNYLLPWDPTEQVFSPEEGRRARSRKEVIFYRILKDGINPEK
jgi:hypothetical protein